MLLAMYGIAEDEDNVGCATLCRSTGGLDHICAMLGAVRFKEWLGWDQTSKVSLSQVNLFTYSLVIFYENHLL